MRTKCADNECVGYGANSRRKIHSTRRRRRDTIIQIENMFVAWYHDSNECFSASSIATPIIEGIQMQNYTTYVIFIEIVIPCIMYITTDAYTLNSKIFSWMAN